MRKRWNKEKRRRKNIVIVTGTGGIIGNIERRNGRMVRGEIGVKVNVKKAFKINKDKMMLTKIESWEQKENIMLNKSKLKE
jgi:hypothetical protein